MLTRAASLYVKFCLWVCMYVCMHVPSFHMMWKSTPLFVCVSVYYLSYLVHSCMYVHIQVHKYTHKQRKSLTRPLRWCYDIQGIWCMHAYNHVHIWLTRGLRWCFGPWGRWLYLVFGVCMHVCLHTCAYVTHTRFTLMLWPFRPLTISGIWSISSRSVAPSVTWSTWINILVNVCMYTCAQNLVDMCMYTCVQICVRVRVCIIIMVGFCGTVCHQEYINNQHF